MNGTAQRWASGWRQGTDQAYDMIASYAERLKDTLDLGHLSVCLFETDDPCEAPAITINREDGEAMLMFFPTVAGVYRDGGDWAKDREAATLELLLGSCDADQALRRLH